MSTFLGSAVIRADTVSVPNPPVDDCEFLVPCFAAGDDSDFETVRITTDGSVSFPMRKEGPLCLFTAVPVLFVSGTQSAVHGDMELTDVSLEIFPGTMVDTLQPITAHATRAFPDGTNTSVVLLGGRVQVSESGTIAQLPEGFRPMSDVTVAVTRELDVVAVKTSGEVVVVANSVNCEISLDNIRFVTSDSVVVIRPRFPHRSLAYRIPISQLDGNSACQDISIDFASSEFDLMTPLTVATDRLESYCIAVCVVTRSGSVFVLQNDCKGFRATSHVVLSSLMTTNIASAEPRSKLSALAIASHHAFPSDSMFSEFETIVANKMSAIVFSRLSGEKESRCMRKDREWRRTRPVAS